MITLRVIHNFVYLSLGVLCRFHECKVPRDKDLKMKILTLFFCYSNDDLITFNAVHDVGVRLASKTAAPDRHDVHDIPNVSASWFRY